MRKTFGLGFLLGGCSFGTPAADGVVDLENCVADPTVACAEALFLGERVVEGREVLELGCERARVDSCFLLGRRLFHGQGMDQDQELALVHLIRADQRRNGDAAALLGVAFRDGMGTTVSPETAAHYFDNACNREHVQGCYDLGILYADGSLPVDTTKSGTAFMTACGFGHAMGCWNASSLVEQGLYTPFGEHTAESLKARACALGEGRAC